MKKIFKMFGITALLFMFCSCSDSDDDVSPDAISLEKTKITCSAEGEESTLNVESSVEWKLSGMSSWCTITPNGGEGGESTVSVKVKANEKASSRTATFVFTAGVAKETLVVEQAAAEFLTLSEDTLSFEQEGKTEVLSIVASGDWTVEGATEWCTLDKTSGTGDGEVNVTTLLNGGEERTTTLVFTMGEIKAEVVVVQAEERIESILEKEKKALKAFYEATGGEAWSERANWLDDEVPLEDWFGVKVDDDGRVIALKFIVNNLKGSIPPEIANLKRLQVLHVNMSELEGSLPVELAELIELKELTIRQSLLSGSIPVELSKLKNLRTLDFEGNHLTGTIPEEIGELSNLTKLNFFRNNLEGAIPSSLSNLVNLTDLMLGYNQLEGELSLFWGMKELQYLNLVVNKLSGEISTEVGTLTKLESINLAENNLTGSLPKELVASPVLTYFDVEGNRLTGEIPSEILNYPDFDWTSKWDWNRICNQQDGYGFTNSPVKPY